MSDLTVLAFDTSAAHCAAALLSGGRIKTKVEEMGRGQAERLIPFLQELLAQEGVAIDDLDRIGVGTGPGNFTGIRISVSAARGLALSLEIPAIGVTGFDALKQGGAIAAAIPGPRETAYLQKADAPPEIVAWDDVPDGAIRFSDPGDLVAAIAWIAAERAPDVPPTPFYLRPADAAPARDAPPVILE